MNNLAIENVNHAPVGGNNVVGINNSEASACIFTYLEDRKKKSIDTYSSYKRYFSEFFMFTCNKQINELTWNDIFQITFNKTDEFYRNEKNKNINSAQQKMFAIKKLWEKLYHLNRHVNPNKNIDLDVIIFEKENIDNNHYATLNSKEVNLLFEHSLTYEYKPKTRYLFFKFLYTMGCRESVAKGKGGKGVKWADIIRKEDGNTEINVWVMKFHDKGKLVEKAMHDNFYNELLKLKGTESFSEYVFDLNINTLLDTFNDFRDKYNLKTKNGRDVAVHSLKRSTGKLVQSVFNDPEITRKHLQHSNLNMTSTYIDDEEYTDQASYMLGEEIDFNVFRDLSKDELLGLIENCERGIQLKLWNLLKKIK